MADAAANVRNVRLRTIARCLLGIVFLLGAADPTPRFLGLARHVPPPASGPFHAKKVKTVLASYDLPVAVRSSEDSRGAPQTIAELAPRLAPLVVAPVPVPAREPLEMPATGNGTGPPLRC